MSVFAQTRSRGHENRRDNPHAITPGQIGAETPAGAQAKVDAITPAKIGAETPAGAQEKADAAEAAAKAASLPKREPGQVLEIGQYLDFHEIGGAVDYHTRLRSDASVLRVEYPGILPAKIYDERNLKTLVAYGTIDVGAGTMGYINLPKVDKHRHFLISVYADDWVFRYGPKQLLDKPDYSKLFFQLYTRAQGSDSILTFNNPTGFTHTFYYVVYELELI